MKKMYWTTKEMSRVIGISPGEIIRIANRLGIPRHGTQNRFTYLRAAVYRILKYHRRPRPVAVQFYQPRVMSGLGYFILVIVLLASCAKYPLQSKVIKPTKEAKSSIGR